MLSVCRRLGTLAFPWMFLALFAQIMTLAQAPPHQGESDRASDASSSHVPYREDQVLFYSPTFGRLTFDSAVVCDTQDCLEGSGPPGERAYVDFTLSVACGNNVGTEPEAKNAYLETTVTVRKRMHGKSRSAGAVTLAASGGDAGFYEESSQGSSPMATYPCPDPNQSPSRYFSEDSRKTLSRLRDAGYDTYQIDRPLPMPGRAEADSRRDSSCVQALVANWVHGEMVVETPLCAIGDKGGQVQWAPN